LSWRRPTKITADRVPRSEERTIRRNEIVSVGLAERSPLVVLPVLGRSAAGYRAADRWVAVVSQVDDCDCYGIATLH